MLADISQLRRDIARHGITWEQKSWLVFGYQGGLCPICQEPLELKGAHIDHFHGCSQSALHKKADAGCPNCIRGALHRYCNGSIVFSLEKYPHLQNDFVKQYLSRRPFLGQRDPNHPPSVPSE